MLLKCTSSYPAPIELANMRTMVDMKERFDVQVGLSDHTIGDTVPIVATSLGAQK
ncbi:MAG: N-acetylneuraminate synthase family protein [Fodinibius sp.]|nr:N-acetylneuraminate synthase family protein [Fodinibius sp.]